MRYYIYISDQKVEMLAAQIPERKLRSLVHRLQLSITMPWLPLSVNYKPGDPLPSDSHRMDRLRVVEEAIEEAHELGELGDITEGRPWIKSSLEMAWGFIDDKREAVCFFGEVSGTTIVLGGSAKHLLGGVDVKQQPHGAYSLLNDLTEVLLDKGKANDKSIDSGQLPDVIAAARKLVETANEQPREQLSFLARRLTTAADNSGKVILATPLYVASSSAWISRQGLGPWPN